MSRELVFSARRKDFRIDTFSAGGPGGQHQNKTASCVRITHLETGLSAECREHRSQHANRKDAFRRLVKLLVAHHCERERQGRYGAGHAVVRTYNEPDDRVTDPTTGARYSFKQTVGRGRMDEMIEERAYVLGMQKDE